MHAGGSSRIAVLFPGQGAQSVGMLGIAALYLEGLRAGRTALYRTTAITPIPGLPLWTDDFNNLFEVLK